MSVSRTIFFIFMAILFAFLHVFLQTETIKMGYQLKRNEDALQELIENNRVLHYNIYALESPYRLERYVGKKQAALKHLEPLHVLSVQAAHEKELASAKDVAQEPPLDDSLLLSLQKLFAGKQAEAKTIK